MGEALEILREQQEANRDLLELCRDMQRLNEASQAAMLHVLARVESVNPELASELHEWLNAHFKAAKEGRR